MSDIPMKRVVIGGKTYEIVDQYAREHGVTIDSTLTQSGQAADAKATGDAIGGVKSDLKGTEAVLLKDRQLYKGFLSANTVNYNANAYFAVIDVVSGQKITVGADTMAVNIAVLKSFTYGEAPAFSEADGFTGRISVPANQTRGYTIPSDGKHLLVLMENLGSSIAPKSLIIGKYDICKNVPDNYNNIYSEFDYKASVKKPTNFSYQTQNGVVFSVDSVGNQSVVGTPTMSMAWYSASFLQKENAKAVLTGKPTGVGGKYWLRLQESTDGEEFTLVSDANQGNSNDSYFDLEAGKYYRLAFGITSNAVGSTLNLSFKAILFSGGYIAETVQDEGEEEDGLTDIIIPHIVDTMEGHETNIYFDTLSRYDGMENQYSFRGIPHGMYRNEFCTRFTPTASDTTFYLNAVRYDKETAKEKERKRVYFNVNHPLQSSLTKNVMIMGDSLTDADTTALECYRMLTADADCTINHIGTLGETGGENEGRSGWKWFDYISPSGTRMTNYDNPFWDTANNRLDFKKYCQTNGYSGLDYVLINLGTNNIIPMNVVDSPDGYADVIAQAKTFLTALLSEDYGYPNCKVAIALLGIGPYYSARIFENANEFRKKFNMLNVAYLYAFDNGAWHPNVTCFALGSSTNRKYGYGYTETAISARFPQLTLQEDDLGIHPSTAGYLSWADAYYCKIRTWLTEDSQ
jgi:lysophospholipase L1-like esterase